MTSKTDRLLYVEEVAEMLRKSPASVRFMIHAGTIRIGSAKTLCVDGAYWINSMR